MSPPNLSASPRLWRTPEELASIREGGAMAPLEDPPHSHPHEAARAHAHEVSARPAAEASVPPRRLKVLDGPAGRAAVEGRSAEAEPEALPPVERRRFLQVLGVSLAMGAGCTKQPEERIVPYVKAPEDLVLGRPLFYATATLLGGVATGVLVEQHEGRPTKLEGNPEHPQSLGGTDTYTQSAIYELYDPDRSQAVTHLGEIRTWAAFLGAMQKLGLEQKQKRGKGLRVLSGALASPTLLAALDGLRSTLPDARFYQHEPLDRRASRQGSAVAFGRELDPQFELDAADVIVALDADFLGHGDGKLRHARAFAARRVPRAGQPMNRLYAFEPTPSITGARADHVYAVRALDVERVARALASRLGLGVEAGELPEGVGADVLDAVARDLAANPGKSAVIAGPWQSPAVHALAHAMNASLGNVGPVVTFTEPVVGTGDDLSRLCEEIARGEVEALLLLGVNPVYDAPADLGFVELFQKVPLRVHHGLHLDETAAYCQWHVPAAHSLESWGDARACDGLVTVLQPLIAPLYGGKTALEVLSTLGDRPDSTAHDLVRDHYRGQKPGLSEAALEEAWRLALHDGFVRNSDARREAPPLALEMAKLGAPSQADGLELVLRPDPSVYDGRFTNNAWMLELPRPLTKLTWDNAAFLSPADAVGLRVETGDVVELSLGGATVRAPAYVLPGQARGSVTLHLGYGRTRAGRLGNGVGANAYLLRTTAAPWSATGLAVKKTGDDHDFAITQGHHSMMGRDIVRRADIEDYLAEPDLFSHHEEHEPGSMYPPWEYKGHRWGLAVDLSKCIGCNACVTACQSENNVPVVGKTEVLRGREMHWLRIDRYYEGEADQPTTHFQPVMCQQCETAPCEVVCPVQATVHSDEGLNDMVYNRCVGTKYCSNNCPYKVRRYNFFGYSVDEVFDFDPSAPSLQLMHNPDVTVRTYGVMEKCTYCVQRINFARVKAKKEGDGRVRDGDVMSACQAVCPARAISFGDLADTTSEVAQQAADARNYRLLDAELNTRPRTSYLAVLRNPNPELAKG